MFSLLSICPVQLGCLGSKELRNKKMSQKNRSVEHQTHLFVFLYLSDFGVSNPGCLGSPELGSVFEPGKTAERLKLPL